MTDHRDDDGGGPGPIDLTSLLPEDEESRFEGLVLRVRRDAMAELSRRRRAVSLWGVIENWRRPILAGSGVLAVASLAAMVLMDRQGTTADTASTRSDAWGIPTELARWMESGTRPTPAELVGLRGGR